MDLGGTEALPVDVAVARTSEYVPRLVAFGKDGNAYLVRRLNLGGIGGAVKITKVANTQITTAPAVYNTQKATLVAIVDANGVSCAGGNITMLHLTPRSSAPIRTRWCAALNGGGAPIITTTDGSSDPLVWVVGAEGDNQLHAFNALTGKPIVFAAGNTTMQGLHHFQTLIAAEGRLYVGADNTIYAFKFSP